MWYLHVMKFHSAIKKDEITNLSGKWVDLEIILNEVAQTQEENTICSFSYQILGCGVYICRSVGVSMGIGCELRVVRRNRGTAEAGRTQKTHEEKQKGELGEMA